jgi:hypothetical protein
VPRSADAPALVGDDRLLPPLSLTGPPCPSDGPTYSIVLTRRQRSKPPAVTGYDIVVNNPLPRVVWFTFGAMAEYTSSRVEVVDVDSAPVRVWHFGYLDALRLSPGATVTVRVWRELVFPVVERTFTFADEIRVGGVPAARWFGKDGLTAGGELSDFSESGVDRVRWVGPHREAAVLEVDVLCADTIRLGRAD